MALPSAGPKLIGEVISLLDKLPPGSAQLIVDLVKTVAKSKDPVMAAKLATMAAAGKMASHAAANEILRRTR